MKEILMNSADQADENAWKWATAASTCSENAWEAAMLATLAFAHAKHAALFAVEALENAEAAARAVHVADNEARNALTISASPTGAGE